MDYENTILDIKAIIDLGRNAAYSAVSKSMVLTYWNIGKRIVEEEQNGKGRAEIWKKTDIYPRKRINARIQKQLFIT